MPELPDVVVYLECLERRVLGAVLEQVRLGSPFVLRSVDPPPAAAHGRRVTGLRRVGKRLVLECEDDLRLVIHLMIAGRLRWRPPGAALPRRLGLAAFDFADGSLLLTEAGSKKRAALHVVRGDAGVLEHDRGGVEPLQVDLAGFRATLRRERHTIKRTLTDPRLFSGIGNAYSDEILHRAGLSPFLISDTLDDERSAALWRATRDVLTEWVTRLRAEVGDGWPEKVTAFREGMAVHGRYRRPCPVCGSPVQRIAYATNEANYCGTCQTGGRLLADRALSRLLRADWPRTLEELEAGRAGGGERRPPRRPTS